MPMRTAWMLLAATLLLATLGCNDGGGDATPTAEPTRAATEAPSTATRTATPARTVSTTPTATPTAIAACPVAGDACAFANQMAQAVLEGDGDGVFSSASLTSYTCPGPNGGLGGPFPLCDGAAPGEQRAGFPIRRIQSEGGVIGEADASRIVSEWGGRTEAKLSDDYGTGAAKAYTIACPDITATEGSKCADHFSLVFSGLSPGSDASKPGLRTMLVLDVSRDDEKKLRVVGLGTGVLTYGLGLALAGGSGSLSDPAVPSVLAPPTQAATSVTFFPWDPAAG
jgi:hypothetical protein